MNVAEMSLEEIRQRGIEALAQALGPAGMIRFLQQFETGRGDYTAERHGWLPDDMEVIASDLGLGRGPDGPSDANEQR
jgi:hypothetical protein